MAHRKSRLELENQGVAIDAMVRTAKLDPEDVVEQPEIILRDPESGERVKRVAYDKESGESLTEGFGYRYVTEEDERVVSHDELAYYRIRDGREQRFDRFEPTLGAERTISPITWIPVHTIDRYLIERTYEMWGEDDADAEELYRLAKLIRDYGEAPVVEVVLRESTRMSWGIITPQFFADSFAMILRITRHRIEPQHQMPLFDETKEPHRLDPQSPFDSSP